MNLDSIDWIQNSSNTAMHREFLNTFGNNNLSQLVTIPTHYLGNILDILLSDKPSTISNIAVKDHNEIIKSDHFAITFDLKFTNLITRNRGIKRIIRNYKKANWIAINNALNNIDWHSYIDCLDINSAWGKFKNTLNEICDKNIPNITIQHKKDMPWFDAEIHKLCVKKDRLRKKYKRTHDPHHYKEFSDCRKKIKMTIKTKMRADLNDSSNPNALTKKFWSYVKNTSNSTSIPDSIHRDHVYAKSHEKQAEIFNTFFYDQFSTSSSYKIDVDFENDLCVNFKFVENSVRLILQGIDTNKSTGPDGISGCILKNCAYNLAKPLTILFDLSFSMGQLPNDWKIANVVPIHKKSDKSDVNNYRPISLTSLVVKVMEICIRDELYDKCKHLISEKQHGFLPGRSCTTQMISFVDDITYSMNLRKDVDAVYFDFAKAFDSVNHDIILKKLKHVYNINGLLLNFIKACLQNRTQRVVVGGAQSKILPVNSGVPQGSILGPLLFVLFINDIHEHISEETNIALYADDTKIWRRICSYTDCVILNKDIASLKQWAKTA